MGTRGSLAADPYLSQLSFVSQDIEHVTCTQWRHRQGSSVRAGGEPSRIEPLESGVLQRSPDNVTRIHTATQRKGQEARVKSPQALRAPGLGGLAPACFAVLLPACLLKHRQVLAQSQTFEVSPDAFSP